MFEFTVSDMSDSDGISLLKAIQRSRSLQVLYTSKLIHVPPVTEIACWHSMILDNRDRGIAMQSTVPLASY